MFRDAPHPVLLVRADGIVAEMNRAAVRALSVPARRLVGHPVLTVVAEEDRARVRSEFLRVLQGSTRDWATRFTRGDGVLRPFSVRAVPLPDGDVIGGMAVFVSDVTQDHGGRPEVRQLQRLLETIPGQLVLALDLRGTIRYAAGVSRTHFLAEHELVGSELRGLLEPGDRNLDRLREMLEEVREGRAWAGVHWHRRADESVFPLRAYAVPRTDPQSGEIVGALLAGQDVLAEYDWRERARRAGRLAALGRILPEVAAELVDVGSAPHRPAEDSNPALDRIRRLGRALQELAGEPRATVAPVDLEPIVEGVLEARRQRAELAGVTVEAHLEPVPPVSGDRDRLARAVGALLDESLDRAAGGEEGRVEVTLQEQPGGIVLRARDNGSPLTPGEADTAFETDRALASERLELRLPIVRAVVVGHAGRVWTESGSGGLTSFCLELPEEEPDHRLRFRPVPLSIGQPRSVLVVDDDRTIRHALRRFLEKVGYEVTEAWSGRSALARITAEHPPEMVITDLRMDDGSGYWFMEELSRDFPDLVRRTVIVTGDSDHVEVSRLAERTGCPVVRKPLELPALLELLDEVALRD